MKTQRTKNQSGNTPYLSLIMGGALAMSQTTAMGQTPPPLINGLPPAPPIPGGDNQIDFDVTPLPPVPNVVDDVASPTPVTITPQPPLSPPIQIPTSVANPANNQRSLNNQSWYRVDVFGDSPMLLAQVQRVEPKAFVRSGEGVIQAGIFSEQMNAQKLRQSLERNGLRTQITALSSTTTKPSSSVNLPSRYPQKRGYFVIIPGDQRKLNQIVTEVLDSGIDRSYLSIQDYPRGEHLGIGPFEHRTEAQRWNAYFRSVGMNARVYFGR
jgi:hypothetical protein